MATMAQLVQFLIKFSLIIIFFLISGESKKELKIVSLPYGKSITDYNFIKSKGQLFYQGHKFNGYLTISYPSGQIAEQTKYINGLQNGTSKRYYMNGELASLRHYVKGKKTAISKGWWPNGQLKFIGHYQSDYYNGNLKEWYENGQLYRNYNYKDGQEEGSQKAWHIDGRIRANYVVKNGRRYGLIGVKKCLSVNES